MFNYQICNGVVSSVDETSFVIGDFFRTFFGLLFGFRTDGRTSESPGHGDGLYLMPRPEPSAAGGGLGTHPNGYHPRKSFGIRSECFRSARDFRM